MESNKQDRSRLIWYVCLLYFNVVGETYAATDMHTSEGVAVKVEKLDDKKMVLKQEVIVLKQLQGIDFKLILLYFSMPVCRTVYT